MNKLQQLEAKIQEAVPSIMELKFGCEVLVQIDDEFREKNVVSKMGVNEIGIDVEGNFHDIEAIKEADFIEILGRPITLEDVLMAIDISKKKTPLVVGINGEFSEEIQNGWKGHETWKLGSPLQDQSEETIDFLHTLLTNKEDNQLT